MGMCKECGEVFSATEMKDGYCKECFSKHNKENTEERDNDVQNSEGLEKQDTEQISTGIATYEEKMLEAFVGNPHKYDWYAKSFSKFDINGMPTMKWNWSWWAFLGTFWFFLYRKAYFYAFMVFLLSLLLWIPGVGLIVHILIGGYSTYFINKSYRKKKQEIENNINDEQKRIETMKYIGGYNTWAVVIGTIINILVAIGIIVTLTIPQLAGSLGTAKYMRDLSLVEICVENVTISYLRQKKFSPEKDEACSHDYSETNIDVSITDSAIIVSGMDESYLDGTHQYTKIENDPSNSQKEETLTDYHTDDYEEPYGICSKESKSAAGTSRTILYIKNNKMIVGLETIGQDKNGKVFHLRMPLRTYDRVEYKGSSQDWFDSGTKLTIQANGNATLYDLGENNKIIKSYNCKFREFEKVIENKPSNKGDVQTYQTVVEQKEEKKVKSELDSKSEAVTNNGKKLVLKCAKSEFYNGEKRRATSYQIKVEVLGDMFDPKLGSKLLSTQTGGLRTEKSEFYYVSSDFGQGYSEHFYKNNDDDKLVLQVDPEDKITFRLEKVAYNSIEFSNCAQ